MLGLVFVSAWSFEYLSSYLGSYKLTQTLIIPRLSRIKDPEEYTKMETLFQLQRETSQARIEILRLKHSEVLSLKVSKMVKYKKTATLQIKSKNVGLVIPPGSPVEGRITLVFPEEAGDEEKSVEVKPVDFFHTEGLNEVEASGGDGGDGGGD